LNRENDKKKENVKEAGRGDKRRGAVASYKPEGRKKSSITQKRPGGEEKVGYRAGGEWSQ